jgi:Histidine kinase-, DNA gyrase B-, and HSP90-like ATPase
MPIAQTVEIENQLLEELQKKRGTKEVTRTKLRTNEKVIARITDGIYRQPSSALRELLANAFDADATTVFVDTDMPRFSRIVIRDDGIGIGLKTLAYLLQNIGGSAKRTEKGKQLELVDSSDSLLSPSGRRLIGKIGIGLFSVAQLTRHFQIISKVAGEDYRCVADIILNQYSEASASNDAGISDFESGAVQIWSEPAEDSAAHGTEIVLLDLKPQTKELLRSHEIWALIREQEQQRDRGEEVGTEQQSPDFHIGEVDLKSGDTITRSATVPWDIADTPEERFRKLVNGVTTLTAKVSTPALESCLDNYLRTGWTLALALPMPYPEKHPFDTSLGDEVGLFQLSSLPKGQAEDLKLNHKQSVRQVLKLKSCEPPKNLPFNVHIDGLKLLRPISIYLRPATTNAIKNSQLFVGKWKPDLSKIPEGQRGGAFSFEAYLCWSPKVVPKEHQGVVIRVHDASGSLFDESFLKYKVSEQNRLRQITAEVFVLEGLDAALNIDRESFNFSHPHYLLLQQWLHSALRQLTNTLKKLAKDLNAASHKASTKVRVSAIATAASQEWSRVKGDDNEEPPRIQLTEKDGVAKHTRAADIDIELPRKIVFADANLSASKTPKTAEENAALDERVKAIYQVLAAYDVFEKMSPKKQAELMRAIVKILRADSSHE